jgi:hypothetical protein
MLKLKSILISGFLTLIVALTILAAALVLTDMQAVQADLVDQPIVATVETELYYLPLTDAPPQRDITTQRFAPLEATP